MNPYAKETHFGVVNFAPLDHPIKKHYNNSVYETNQNVLLKY